MHACVYERSWYQRENLSLLYFLRPTSIWSTCHNCSSFFPISMAIGNPVGYDSKWLTPKRCQKHETKCVVLLLIPFLGGTHFRYPLLTRRGKVPDNQQIHCAFFRMRGLYSKRKSMVWKTFLSSFGSNPVTAGCLALSLRKSFQSLWRILQILWNSNVSTLNVKTSWTNI